MERPNELRAICQAGKEFDPSWYVVHRRVSIYLTWLLLHTPITPNQISLLMMAVGAGGAWLVSLPDLRWNLAGFVLLYGSFLLDKCDGEVARYRNVRSVRSVLLDRLHHLAIEPAVVFAAAWREYQATGSVGVLLAAFAAIVIGNIIEEQTHWPAYAMVKHLRETRRFPKPAAHPAASGLRSTYRLFRPLKAFRMFIVVLPVLALAFAAQAASHRSVVAPYLYTMVGALAVYLAFQTYYYFALQFESEIESYKPHVEGGLAVERMGIVNRPEAEARIPRILVVRNGEGEIQQRTSEGLRSTS